MRTYSDYISYMSNLAAIHPELKVAIAGDSEEILSSERSEIDYPALWIEPPDIEYKHSGQVFTGAIIVFENTELDDFAARHEVLNRTHAIMIDLLDKIHSDAKTSGLFKLIKPVELDRVYTKTPDNDYGFRAPLRIETESKPCLTSCIPAETPFAPVAGFSWKLIDGDILLTNLSMPDLDDMKIIEWSYIDGDINVIEINSPQTYSFTPSGGFDKIEVQLRIVVQSENYGYEAIATATVFPSQQCGMSTSKPLEISQIV